MAGRGREGRGDGDASGERRSARSCLRESASTSPTAPTPTDAPDAGDFPSPSLYELHVQYSMVPLIQIQIQVATLIGCLHHPFRSSSTAASFVSGSFSSVSFCNLSISVRFNLINSLHV